MSGSKRALFGAAAVVALFALQPMTSFAADGPSAAPAAVAEVIVTAQKRQENIQNVGMSIQAATGDRLTKLGINDTAQLQKIVPGFVVTPTTYGTNVFTIRGVGFQDTSLAGSPTVSVYLDEAPLPFTALTNGTTLDLQRVEVLKGPQGTLFGNNATGGAINYVANKPTDRPEAGADFTYGRFNTVELQGFVSGPITDGLDARLALQHNESGPWQKGYGPQAGQSRGGVDFTNGRFAIQWKPTDNLKALLTLNGWQDKGWSQAGQFYGLGQQDLNSPLSPLLAHYPLAPHNDQAAGWNTCVNNSPFDPIANQAVGTTYPTPLGPRESEGAGSVVQAGGQPTSCVPARRDNTYYSGVLRIDYSLPHDMTATSLTDYQRFDRKAGIDGDGVPVQDYQSFQTGRISSVYQELRLAGKFDGKGSWLVGANYEYDNTSDSYLQTYNASTTAPTALPVSGLCPTFSAIFGYNCTPAELAEPAATLYTLGPSRTVNQQQTTTYAVYGDAEYPITSDLTLQGGVRFTQEDKNYQGCAVDGGDGTGSLALQQVQNLLEVLNGTISPSTYLAGGGFGLNPGPGGCPSAGPGPLFQSPAGGGLFHSSLNENNVSWRTGVNWKVAPRTLLYFNVSQGWKGGSYPTVASTNSNQLKPVVQEGLLAYEGGFKATLFDRTLQINGAGFYYDYSNKQLLGDISDPVFGPLPALVNIPKSHVVGFELSGVWTPAQLPGLTIMPSISYQASRVDASSKNTCSPPVTDVGFVCAPGQFYNFDAFGEYANFTGEKFPSAPEWQASVDAEYDWKLRDDISAFVGANVNYTSSTNTFFVNRSPTPGLPNDPLAVPGHTLVDLRAGVSKDNWRFQIWGHNVTDTWYWTSANHLSDTLVRYTGMPATYGFTLSYRYH